MRTCETILDFIRIAISRFNQAGLYFGHGTENAVDEAHALILQSLHLPHDLHPSFYQAKLMPDEQALLKERIEKRIHERVPVPYLTNQAYFGGLSFYVDERVLIPRSPLAPWIRQHFEPYLPEENNLLRILDLCTGSGCIAILCASVFEEAEVHASDISEEALHVAKINVLRHQLEKRVTLFRSDVFEGLPAHAPYDLIISNPPYVDQEDMMTLPPEYRHEPELGLTAGSTGLDVVKRILKHAAAHLSPNGLLIVEVGNSEHALQEAFPHVPFTWLESEQGSDGAFVITQETLTHYLNSFK